VDIIETNSITVSEPDRTIRLANDHVFIMVGGELPYQLLEKIGITFIEKEI